MINTTTIILIVVGVVFAFVLGFGICWLINFYSKNQKKIIKNAKIEAEKILESSVAKAKENAIKITEELKQLEYKKKQEFLKNEEFLNTRTKNLIERENILNRLEKRNVDKQKLIIQKIEQINTELEHLSGLSSLEAKDKLLKNLEIDLQKDMNKKVLNYKTKTNLKIKKIAENIISNAIEKYAPVVVADKTLSILKIDDDEIKGRIIGKEGRNIRAFEKYSGVDLLINDTPGIIRLSSFNSKRREIAKIALQKLIDSKKIQIQKIESFLKDAKKEFEDKVIEEGEKVIDELNISNVNPKMCNYLGLLNYRTSYGQNVLEHSIEVGKISALIASELCLDSSIALRAGLFHDIGKSIDQENEGSHVTIGVEIAKKYNESNYVINAIESHHGDVEPTSVYSVLVSAADTISAARPGARNNTIENFIQRMRKIEEICNSIDGVVQCYAFQSGREIQVIVDSKKIDDYGIYKISKEIKSKILSADLIIAGNITVSVIREKVAIEKFMKKSMEV